MIYQSVTVWGFDWKDLPGWELEVQYGKFDSIEEAAKFGISAHKIHHCLGHNHLLMCDKIGTAYTISQTDIIVWKQKSETFGRLMIDPTEDLTIVKLDPAEVADLPESFHSLSYGVVDKNGRKLDLNKIV